MENLASRRYGSVRCPALLSACLVSRKKTWLSALSSIVTLASFCCTTRIKFTSVLASPTAQTCLNSHSLSSTPQLRTTGVVWRSSWSMMMRRGSPCRLASRFHLRGWPTCSGRAFQCQRNKHPSFALPRGRRSNNLLRVPNKETKRPCDANTLN